MLKTSEESERTDDFFAPSPHPESYPSQPSLSMWGGNTWQPHRGTHCHTGGSHWVQSQRYPHCGGAEDQQGHHSKANIYQGAATQICMKYIKRAPQPGKYIGGSHTQTDIKYINMGTTARQIYISQPHSPLAFMPSQRNHTKQRHTTRKAKEVKSETEMQNLIMGKQLGCDKFFLLTNYVRPERWIVTIPSSDQWLATIGNH